MGKRTRWAAFVAFALFIAAVVAVADLGQGDRFWGFLHGIPLGDKLGHLGLFGLLAVFANLATRGHAYRAGSLRIAKGSVWVFAAALVEECSQALIPARSFDLVDLATDLVAVCLAGLLVWPHPAARTACGSPTRIDTHKGG